MALKQNLLRTTLKIKLLIGNESKLAIQVYLKLQNSADSFLL